MLGGNSMWKTSYWNKIKENCKSLSVIHFHKKIFTRCGANFCTLSERVTHNFEVWYLRTALCEKMQLYYVTCIMTPTLYLGGMIYSMNNWSAQKFARHRVFFLFFVWSFYLPLWNFLTTQIDYIQDSELLSKRAHKNLKCLVIFPIEITTCTCWFRYFVAYTPMCRLQKHVFFF